MNRDLFSVTFRAEPGDSRPVAIRLRLLLKFALRGCSMRCVELIPAAQDMPGGETGELAERDARTATGAN